MFERGAKNVFPEAAFFVAARTGRFVGLDVSVKRFAEGIEIKGGGELVVTEAGLTEISEIEVVVAVHTKYVVGEGFEVWEVGGVDEGAGIEIEANLRIAPVDGDGAGPESID